MLAPTQNQYPTAIKQTNKYAEKRRISNKLQCSKISSDETSQLIKKNKKQRNEIRQQSLPTSSNT